MGVRRFMDFLCAVAPSPAEMHAPVTTTGKEVKPDPAGPTSLFFFKTSTEPHIDEVLHYKVMSGKIKGGDDMVNISRNGSKERISQIFSPQAPDREILERCSMATTTSTPEAILEAVGGPGNIVSFTHCATRLRFELHDASVIDKATVEKIPGDYFSGHLLAALLLALFLQ